MSSAVAVTRAPSFTKNRISTTGCGGSPSCRTCASTPGFPNLYIRQNSTDSNRVKDS